MTRNAALSVLLVASMVVAPLVAAQAPAEQPSAASATPDPWPKSTTVDGDAYTIYQPQIDSWDGYHFEAHAAVSVLVAGAKDPAFGQIELTAVTAVDQPSRTVDFRDIKVSKATFPSEPGKAEEYRKVFQKEAVNGPATMSLDRLQTALAIEGVQKKARQTPVKNEPPVFVFSQTPAILVLIDGTPVFRAVQGAAFERVLNTRPLLLRTASGQLYLHLLDGFVQASSLTGTWSVATSVPEGADQLAESLSAQHLVNLMPGQPDDKTKQPPSLKNGAPGVVVATKPTELIVTDGKPQWAPINGTNLLYLSNTTANVFMELATQKRYVLVAGRWFTAPELTGPWVYVPGKELPHDFALIPDSHAKENAKASVPGTPQSEEALIANEIPQTAVVDPSKAKFAPQVDGEPKLEPIPETTLAYVSNAAAPIIMVNSTSWYACQNGIWFAAPAVPGPWTVATSVPATVYMIPPSSPLYYVTYVRIYSATPAAVVVGYTPGYMGTVVSVDGVVVYGTGYAYPPYIGTTVWYPAPVTYGYAASIAWTPWTGWAVGFGFGWAMGVAVAGGACWGAAPYWGPMAYGGVAYGAHGSAAAWGPGGWAATSGNVYSHYGSTTAMTRTSGGYNAWTGNAWSSQVGHSYNSTTGQISAGQRGSVQNVYTGNYAYGSRGATYNPSTGVAAAGKQVTVGNAYTGNQKTYTNADISGPGGQSAHVQQSGNNVYAEHDGSVYKNTGGGFQQYNSDGSWGNLSDSNREQSLQSQAQARQAGDQRSAGSAWGGNWGGGFNRGGGGGGFAGGGSFGGFRGGGGGFRR